MLLSCLTGKTVNQVFKGSVIGNQLPSLPPCRQVFPAIANLYVKIESKRTNGIVRP
jgi:hypothetical protein